MDQLHGGKEEEHSVQDPTDHRRKGDDAAVERGDHAEPMDSRDGYEAAEETTGVLKEEEVVGGAGGSEEEDSPPLFARPCSLLQLLLRFCGGCLGLHGYCSDDDPKPAAAAAADADAPAPQAAAAVADSPQEGEGGERSSASEVVTRVMWTVRRPPTPPGRPREGPVGGNGGVHH